MIESPNLKSFVTIGLTPEVRGTATLLPASKSISNRVLILNALAKTKAQLHNLSDANDTQLMQRLIGSNDQIIDVEDAGTTMRFLTAYFAITMQKKTLTGTERMKERPIGILVDALRSLGAGIGYLEKPGFPPLSIRDFQGQQTRTLQMRGDVSSQFISAVMMIAPRLPEGLTLNLEGRIGSRPYIEMTAQLMASFGVTCKLNDRTIEIPPGQYTGHDFTVESDWSAASYWFAIAALASDVAIKLPRISLSSLQGDRAIVDIMQRLGVSASMSGDFLVLSRGKRDSSVTWDFTHCPDLAQTVAVVCAASGVEGRFTGLESLRIKETDRIAALQHELAKIGARLEEQGSEWVLIPSTRLPSAASFETYKDHRMAMAFAPLATKMQVTVKDPLVVRKSYPNFWNDLRHCGFTIEVREEN